jgi:hypothetical protein
MYKNLNKKAQELKIEKNENKDDIQKKEIQI